MRFAPLIISNITVLVYTYFYFTNYRYMTIFTRNIVLKWHFSFIITMIKKFPKLLTFQSNQVKIAIKNMTNDSEVQNLQTEQFAFKIGVVFLIINFILIIQTFINNYLIIVLGIILSIVVWVNLDLIVIKRYENHILSIKSDLPDYITRLALLVNSGTNLRSSMKYINKYSSGTLIKELEEVNAYIDSGTSEVEAYSIMMNKCNDIFIRKFISTILVNIKTGSENIEKNLLLMKKESDELRKSNLLKRTQDSNRRLLIPNLLIFSGILVLVMLPMLLKAI